MMKSGNILEGIRGSIGFDGTGKFECNVHFRKPKDAVELTMQKAYLAAALAHTLTGNMPAGPEEEYFYWTLLIE